MKSLSEIRSLISEETMPYALDDKGRIGIDDEDAIENINSLLSGITAGGFQTPYIALERVRKTLANFHIHLPKVTFDDGDNDSFTFEISQFGNKMGMTNSGEFVKNDSTPYYLYFEYSLNGMGNYGVFAEIVNEEDLADLMDDEESDDEEDESEIQGADQNQSYDTNQDEHKGMRMSEEKNLYHGSYTDAVNAAVAHAEKRGYKLADGERDKVALGPKKPGEGKTVSHNLALEKDGKPSKKALHFQVYNRGGETPYELNHYISEETEQLDEISQEKKDRYVERASSEDSMARVQRRLGTGKAKKDAEEIIRKRSKGMNMALKEHLIARGWKLIND